MHDNFSQIAENLEKTLKRFKEVQQQVDDIKKSTSPVEVSFVRHR